MFVFVLSFLLALGQPWARDGGIPQGCPLEYDVHCSLLLFTFLGVDTLALSVVSSLQLYADNLKCVSLDPGLLLRTARFTTGYVRQLVFHFIS